MVHNRKTAWLDKEGAPNGKFRKRSNVGAGHLPARRGFQDNRTVYFAINAEHSSGAGASPKWVLIPD